MSEQSAAQAAVTRDQARLERLRSIASGHYEKWAASPARSGAVGRARGGTDGVRRLVDRKIESLLAEPEPGNAVRRWLLESVAAWAPLAVVFSPRAPETQLPGVSGVLSVHAQEVLEKAYSHVLASAPSAGRAIEMLTAEVQQLELQMEVAEAAGWLYCDPDSGETLEWIHPFREMSLAMAEYLHRDTLRIPQLLTDALAMSYSAQLARTQRELQGGARGPLRVAQPVADSPDRPAAP